PSNGSCVRRGRSAGVARGRSARACRTGRRRSRRIVGASRLASPGPEWLAVGIAFVETVPVRDALLPVLPAEVDDAAAAPVRKVDGAEREDVCGGGRACGRGESLLHTLHALRTTRGD